MTNFAQIVQIARSKPITALLAIATHYVLHSGEWDNTFHIFLGIWTFAFSGLAVAEFTCDPRVNSVIAAAKVSATAATVYFTVLITSILLHRGFLHRLRHVRKGTHCAVAPLTTLTDPWAISSTSLQVLQRLCRSLS
jgi:hypothetical protein